MKRLLQILLPLTVIVIGVGLFFFLQSRQTEEQPVVVEKKKRTVSAVIASPQTLKVPISSRGFVQARATSIISAELAGKIIGVSDQFRVGKFFKTGDEICQIDRADYQSTVAITESREQAAKKIYEEEERLSDDAVSSWKKRTGSSRAPSPGLAREAQLAAAKSNWSVAQEEVKKARAMLERTSVKAPFDSLVLNKQAELGQFVSPGIPIVTLAAVDYAEIRIPLGRKDFQFLKLKKDQSPVPVAIQSGDIKRKGQLVRTENVIDQSSRSIYAIVRLSDPYARSESSKESPVMIGDFIEVKMLGMPIENVTPLPQSSLVADSRVVVVNKASKLTAKTVEVVVAHQNTVFVRGLEDGEKVVSVSPHLAIEGEDVEVTIDSAFSPDL